MPKKTGTKGDPVAAMDVVQDVLEGIQEVSGKGGAQLLGSDGLSIKIRGVISTQCATVDAAIGRGGIPIGRLTLVHGKEGGGKTTLALHIVAEVQRRGGIAVYQDMEYKLDPDYAKALGVDTERLIISQPSCLEECFEASEKVIQKSVKIRQGGHDVPILIVLDSMNAALSRAEVEGDWSQVHVGPQARVFSRLTPKLIPLVSRADVALLWVSQIRQKIGVSWGDDTELAGGKAPRFYASLMIDVRRMQAEKSGDIKVANKIVAECKKNQIAPPFRKGEFFIRYGEGIDRPAALLVQAASWGLVDKNSGNTYVYGGQKIGVGLARAAKALAVDEALYEKLQAEVRKYGKWHN